MGTIDNEDTMEAVSASQSQPAVTSSPILSLQKAIELGEYEADYLSQFSEWNQLSRHSQFQLIKQALENRLSQLAVAWSDINNLLDFSKKPHLQDALRNIEEQRLKVLKDKESLYMEYSKF